jgi:RecA DNA recombination protein
MEDGVAAKGRPNVLRAGSVIEVIGPISSGRTSLLLSWLADATRAGGVVALVDVDGTFDPRSATRSGIDLRRVLWVRAGGRRDRALSALGLLARCPGFALVAFDAGELSPRVTLTHAFRVKRALRGGVLVVVGRHRMMGAAADLAIETVQEGCEWTGAGSRARRLDAVRTRLHLLRPQSATHPRVAGAWPRHARWIA